MAVLFVNANGNGLDIGLNIPGLNAQTGSTLMAWIRAVSFTNSGGIINLSIGPPPGTSSNTRAGMTMRTDAGVNIQSRDTDGSGLVTNVLPGPAITTTTWQHICATFNIATKVVIGYLNGAINVSFLNGYATGSYSATNSKNGGVGAEDDVSSTFMDGRLADCRVYNRVLSADEIATIFAARGADSNVNGLLNRWKLLDLAPGAAVVSAKDSASLQRNLAPIGAPAPSYLEHPIHGIRRRRV